MSGHAIGTVRLRPTLARLLAAIQRHFAHDGCAPSLNDLGRATRMSRSRVADLLPELEVAGVITRERGKAHSIRLVHGLGNFSDDELLLDYARLTDELVRRGYGEVAAQIGQALRVSYPEPVIEPESAGVDGFGGLLARLDNVDLYQIGGGS